MKTRLFPHLEVNSIPEHHKYIKLPFFTNYFIKPILRRFAWAATFALSVVSIVPLLLKCIINLLDSYYHPHSRIEAKKNAVGILIAPLISLLSLLSVIFPSFLGSRIGKIVVLPITLLYYFTHTPSGKRSLKEEIGPRPNPTPFEHEAFLHFSLFNKTIHSLLPSNRSFPIVTGVDGIEIDTVDIPLNKLNDSKATRIRLVFCAAAEMYQLRFNKIPHENELLHCDTRLFNYPGVTKNNATSSLDWINAGIAEVYDLAKKNNWSNAELEKNCHLSGYCFGGAVALQVAAYFKEKHNIDLLMFIDRSFTSYLAAMAGVLHTYSGLPFFLSQLLASTFLYGAGDLNMDSMAAIKKINPQKLYPINLGHPTPPILPKTRIEKLKYFFGIGKKPNSADNILQDGTALADGIKEAKIASGSGTRQILTDLHVMPLDVAHSYSSGLGHFYPISELSIEPGQDNGKNVMDFYIGMINKEQPLAKETTGLKLA